MTRQATPPDPDPGPLETVAAPEDPVSPLLPEAGAAMIADALMPGENRLAVAVSGGPDSTALMHAVAELVARHEHYGAIVISVDHGLRPESADEAAQVVAQARSLGLDAKLRRWERAQEITGGVQQAARAARYRILAQEARKAGAPVVLTAHTADDQAETVLMRLCSGSGIDGLAAMAPRASMQAMAGIEGDDLTLVRPFLGIAKARLTGACAHFGWWYLRDPANTDPRHTRARLRALMPVLAREGLTAPRLARLARRAGETREALDHGAKVLFDRARLEAPGDNGLRLDGAVLRDAPIALVQRVLRRAFVTCGDGNPDTGSNGYGPSLEKCEALARALQQALKGHDALPGRTLGGIRLACTPDGLVSLNPAKPRRAGT